MKTIHHYDFNGIYIESSEARFDTIGNEYLIPARATDVELPEHDENTELCRFDGKHWIVESIPVQDELSQRDKAVEQYNAIDNHIAVSIKANGWDYDNLGEVAAYMQSNIDEYKIEALTIWAWIEQCQLIQTGIRTGERAFNSVDDAINELPSFPFE